MAPEVGIEVNFNRHKDSCKMYHTPIFRHHNDPYVKRAKEEGYRARSAYKLIEIDKKVRRRLFGAGKAVLECGCSPGAWSQVILATFLGFPMSRDSNLSHLFNRQTCC